ncbi:mycothiol synthase [Candidatus Nanopelagicus hibericus]|uniref:Mycothiol acetyltransferase n=1 Tax=Candidatus Nanopelagicus hibericus TaxID=1884915 RepID=A0A249KAG9_9ACTN|nr:mycothiol synthase [Candidatus Nanopelagicus hibericus]ASY13787.1 mycothiol synthase [Candidatus Nanopelagicus hibericus]
MQHLNHLSKSQQESALALIKAAHDFDGTPPIAEHVLLHLRHGGDKSDSHIVFESSNQVIAYAHLDTTDLVAGPSVEAVVHPNHRGKGLGALILKEAIKVCGDKTRIWSHGDLPAAKAIATSLNLERLWSNLLMSKSLGEIQPVTSKYPIRTFIPDLDNQAFLSLNNKVFSNYPDQGGWSGDDLKVRLNEAWFEKEGFFVAEAKGELIGFCWTKIHGAHTHSHSGGDEDHGHDALGEIYVLAVNPDYKGQGIGRDLTITGLNYLKYQGLNNVMLYVGVENKPAFNLYKSLGFNEFGSDVMYRVKS